MQRAGSDMAVLVNISSSRRLEKQSQQSIIADMMLYIDMTQGE